MTAPATAPVRQPWEKQPHKHGKTIVGGEVRFASVSSLELAGRCLRRWWYAYRQNLKEGPSPHLDRGNEGHEQIARHLYTGERGHLGSLVLQGMNQLPPPGPDLLIEHPLVEDLPDGTSGLMVNARLRVAGIPMIGSIDVAHGRRENYGVQDPSDAIDEPGVLKLVDHKFPSSLNNAKSGPELADTIQMAGYGLWAFETFPGLERVRLTHNYFPTRGTPRAPTTLVDREPLERTWRQATAIGNSIKHAAREANPDLIDANTRDCRSYGRDCPAKHVCRAASHNSLSSLVGVTAADRLLRSAGPPSTPADALVPLGKRPVGPGVLPGEDMTTPSPAPMSLVARLAAQRAAAAGTPAPAAAPPLVAPTPPRPPAPPPPAAAPGPTAEVLAEMDRLRAAEAAAAQPVTLLLAEIASHGMGQPALGGAAAAAVAAEQGFPLVGGSLAGTGELGAHVFSEIAELEAVRAELPGIVAQRAAAGTAAAIVQAADQIESALPAVAPAAPAKERKPRGPNKKKDAPAQTTTETPATPAIANNTVIVYATEPAASAAPDAYLSGIVASLPAQDSTSSSPVELAPAAPTTGPISVYVDCVVYGITTTPLWPLVHLITQNMSEDSDAPDYRCSDPQGKYGYGRGKGVLAACLREAPSKGLMPPGSYSFDGSMGEIGSTVVETMRQIAHSTGGTFVKGCR